MNAPWTKLCNVKCTEVALVSVNCQFKPIEWLRSSANAGNSKINSSRAGSLFLTPFFSPSKQVSLLAGCYVFTSVVCIFIFLAVTWRDFLYHCKRRIFGGLFKHGFKGTLHWNIFSEHHLVLVSSFFSLHLTFWICMWLQSLWSVHYKPEDLLKFFFGHETYIPTKLVQPLFCQLFVFKQQIIKALNVFLDLYLLDLNTKGQNMFSHMKPDKKNLKAYYRASCTWSFPSISSWRAWRHA